MEKQAKIYVASHEGMIGGALVRRLAESGFENVLTRGHSRLDLTDQRTVAGFFNEAKPDYVLLPSVKVGGIKANAAFPADFIYENLQAQTNVIHQAWRSGVKKLLFLASSCIYPKVCLQPMSEDALLTGPLEPTSEPYAVAKIAGIRMCQAYRKQYGADFVAAVPADAYGPGDDFDPETAHVLAALVARIHRAKVEGQPEVVVWGTGSPKREILYVDDLAAACLFLMEKYDDAGIINIGGGKDIAVGEMALAIRDVVGYKGEITFDASQPDGAPRKLLDNGKILRLGWTPRTGLAEGLERTYRWYLENDTAKERKN